MTQETIKFIIKQDGTVTEEVMGVYGDACEKLTENVEKKLGNIQYREPTADMYRSVVEHDHVSVSTQEQPHSKWR
jgi:hypothetical protein|tara:strand:+ start:329 stop:553 length:225 start_codon:yes stop_codon:yes gene_type:complete